MSSESLKPSKCTINVNSSCEFKSGSVDPFDFSLLTEQEEHFIVLCQNAETQDELNAGSVNIHRRASMHCISSPKISSKDFNRHRRHSSFNPRHRQAHLDDHANHLVRLLETENREVSSVVNTLLDFHSSFEISLASSSRQDLHISCPVLSYMYDSDDDSIEISKAKKPSLTSNPNRNETFKIANDMITNNHAIELDSFGSSMDHVYLTRLQTMQVPTSSRKREQRNRLSYKQLERRLATESHLAVFKSLIMNESKDLCKELECYSKRSDIDSTLDVAAFGESHIQEVPLELSKKSFARVA